MVRKRRRLLKHRKSSREQASEDERSKFFYVNLGKVVESPVDREKWRAEHSKKRKNNDRR